MEKIEIPLEVARKRAVETYVGLLSYVMAVGERIGREEALKILGSVTGAGWERWVNENLPRLGIVGNDARAGNSLTTAFFSGMLPGTWKPEEHVLVEDTPTRVVSHDTHFCPILEACKALGLSTREVCPTFEPAVEAMLKPLNPKLSFRIEKVRPEADYCEHMIELKE